MGVTSHRDVNRIGLVPTCRRPRACAGKLSPNWLLRFVLAAAFLIATTLPAVAGVDTPSSSKISIHQLSGYTSGAAAIVQAHPRVLKIVGVTGGALGAMRDYKASTPQGIVVVRIYTPIHFQVTDDPAASANTFWNSVLAPPLNSLSPTDKALIDYVEGPNEQDNTPTWGSLQDATWFNTFW